MNDPLAKHVLEDALRQFRQLKAQADKARAQVDDQQLFTIIDPASNSLAVIMKHLSGNLRSRWTDFLTSDGEKPNRQRDTEFEMDDATTRQMLLEWWEEGWKCLFEALAPLQPEDLRREVMIRGEAQTVVIAINRQLTHYAAHIGQIVFLARHLKSSDWQTLSVPRGQSAKFNRAMLDKLKTQG